MNCEFTTGAKGDNCRRCGYVIKVTPARPLDRECTMGCAHKGNPTKRIMVECECANGGEVSYPTAECAIFRRCVPDYIPPSAESWAKRDESSIYRLCHGCDRFSPDALGRR